MHFSAKAQTTDLAVTSALLVGLLFLFHQTPLDVWLAGHFFEKSQWVYRDNFILEKLLHKGGVILVVCILVGIVTWLLAIHKKDDQRQLKNYLIFILFSSALTIVLVFLLKRWTTLPCPWNSMAFAGGTQTPPLWDMFSPALSNAHCFPGGHSSGGYAFLSMYFGYTFIYGKRNFYTLIPGVLIGLIFGITQQMRGAHFMSHDIATILISIFSSWITMLVYTHYNKNYEAKIIAI